MAYFSVADLSSEEQQILVNVRRKKTELIDEIQKIQEELKQVNSQIESLNINGDDSNTRLKLFFTAKKKFNFDAKKGLQFMFDRGLLTENPESVANFLYENSGLKKTSIGDYLGEKNDFNLKVLEKFVTNHNFSGISIVQALRNFLWHFRLPGESQKIDRIMEQFAKHFCCQNPEIFDHSDTCYTLCYATIMLNTSLYNPSVKERMSLDNFIQLTSSMNVSKELVNLIYNSIRSEPFKFPEENEHDSLTTFFQVDKQGWLTKQGSRYKTWSKRWFVLTDKCLCYFELSNDKEPKGIIPLENVKVRAVEDDKTTRTNTFEIYSNTSEIIKACKTDPTGRLIESQHTVYRMSAATRDDMLSWISAIQRGINKEHYFDLIQSRRKRMLNLRTSDPTLNKFQ